MSNKREEWDGTAPLDKAFEVMVEGGFSIENSADMLSEVIRSCGRRGHTPEASQDLALMKAVEASSMLSILENGLDPAPNLSELSEKEIKKRL